MTAKRACVAIYDGNYRYANLYYKPGNVVECGPNTYKSLEEARANRCEAEYICTIKITTKVEIA